MPNPTIQKDGQASRLRENKRRHRARQKEYVQDLERRVAQAQEQGMQATIAMQLTAQRVASENVRLRSFLRELGISDTIVESWVSKDTSAGTKPLCPGSKPQMEKMVKGTALSNQQEAERAEVNFENTSQAESSSSGTCIRRPESRSAGPSFGPVRSNTLNKETPNQVCARSCKEQAPQSQKETRNLATAVPPCRQMLSPAEKALLSSRLSNQSAAGDDELEIDGSDGVECSTAYRTLMQYATSQDKMDRITAALDYGCTPSGGGGCKVKSSVMWKVLDDEC
ncbi:hypothetical protein EJ08DRAFT_683112 [Tothia fuscella]|uniref:BZIP domain-containing protein n=1 Tax=Tothia fuscella TaxID=1048955 RepID=A0A9P4TU40_9PEZI|nr:hypothetical protein EJ08DRAFT_683112 [Tothia fuscella]